MDLSDILKERMPSSKRNPLVEALNKALEDRAELWDVVPAKRTGIELFAETDKSQETEYTICNPQTNSYLSLNELAHGVWQLIDGERSVNQIFSELYDRYGLMSIGGIWNTLFALSNGEFLAERIVPLNQLLENRLQTETRWQRYRDFLQKLVRIKYEVKWIERLGERVSRFKNRPAYGIAATLLLAILAAVGLALFVHYFHLAKASLLIFGKQRGNTLVFQLELLVIYVIVFASIMLHELAHMTVVKYNGRRIIDAGFMLYYGVPVFYVNITDIRMAGRGARIRATLAGPFVNGAIGGVLLLAAAFAGQGPAWQVLMSAGMLNIFLFVFNLLPIAELDGNYVFEDLFGIPDLRRKSLQFLRKGFIAKLKGRSSWTREDRVLLSYGILNLLGTLYLLYFALELWFSTARWLFRDIYNSPEFLVPVLGFIMLVFLARLTQLLLRRKYQNRSRINELLAAALPETS